jgi:hypothetical protein
MLTARKRSFVGHAGMWGRLAACAPVVYRRSRRVSNPPDPEGTPSILPHMKSTSLARSGIWHAESR